MNLKIDKKLHKSIIRDYKNGKRCYEIALEFNVDESTIERILKKHNIKSPYKWPRKYSLNFDFFSKINTEASAYFLGLMFADGFNGNDSGAVILQLAERDRELIDLFNKHLQYNRPLTIVPPKKPHHQNRLRIEINSRKVSDDLNSLGCVQRKSLILKFPEYLINSKYLRHFIRGYLDGDGSIFISKGKISCSITSSEFFCQKLNEIIEQKLGIVGFIQKYKSSKAKSWKVSSRKCVIFLDWLYKDATIYLNRKFNRFKDFIGTYTPEKLKHTGGSKLDISEIVVRWN